jgi:hypothetical protein
LALIVAVGVLLTGVSAPEVRADVPPLLNFQGILLDTDGGTVVDSTYEVTFGIYGDSIDGTPLWEETQELATDNGLFNTFLGQSVPVPAEIFADPDRFLEIGLVSVGVYKPRTRIGSVAYAFRAKTVDGANGGSISGNLFVDSGLTVGNFSGTAGFVEVTDGAATVFSTDGADHLTTISGGASSVTLDMDATGDDAVVLPADAVSAGERIDEPGIAANFNASDVPLTQGSLVMTDLVITTITIPADGYIVVEGRSNFTMNGTAGRNVVHVQVDEAQGGGDNPMYRSTVGIEAHSNSGTHNMLYSVFTDRVYFKSAGTYTFRLEARADENNSSGAGGALSNSFIRATFYPTAYGTVNGAK